LLISLHTTYTYKISINNNEILLSNHILASEHYLCFLEDKLPVLSKDVPLHIRQELWLQQDGAPHHFGRQKTAFLNHHFQHHWSEW
jgi:hypothetical protein